MQGNFASISAVRIFEHMRNITAFGPREDGTIAYRQVVGYIEDALSDLGLDVHRQTLSCWVIEPIETSLRVTEPREMDIKCYHGSLTGVTDSAGVQGELAFVNKAFDEDFVGRDLAGKVAIAWQEQYWERGEQPRDKLRRATEHGAIGFIFAMKRRDNLITCWSLSREPAAIPFVSISYPDFLSLRDMMEKGPVELSLRVLGKPEPGEAANVWTVIEGTELPDEMIGIGSCHHETVPMNPGANDNASAQAVLLELARFFKENPQKRSILLMSNCGEETGLWGAASFVEAHRDWLVESLKAMIAVDQAGGTEPVVYSGGTRWLEEMWVEEAEKLGYRLPHWLPERVAGWEDTLGDALPFFKAGIPAAIAGSWPSDFFYHTEEDTPDKVSANGLKAVADSMASLVVRLCSR